MVTPRRDAVRNRQLVLDTARRLYATDHKLGLDEVGKAAGVGAGTVYRNFPTVADLAEGLAVHSFTVLEKLALEVSSEPQATAFLERLLLQLVDDPLFAEILISPALLHGTTIDSRDSAALAISRALESIETPSPIATADIIRLLSSLAYGLRTSQATSLQAHTDFVIVLTGLTSPAIAPT